MEKELDTTELIKKQYQKLPQEVRDAVTASDLPSKMKTIADSHSLMLDQTGILQNEILFVMLGLEPSNNFINNISDELGIKKDKAEKIADDVNNLIFKPIKNYLREWEESIIKTENTGKRNNVVVEKRVDISQIEKAGNFSVEHNESGTKIDGEWGEVTPEDKDRLMKHIEDPVSTTNQHDQHTEPLVDYLLANPIGQNEHKETVEPPDNLPTVNNNPIQKPISPNITHTITQPAQKSDTVPVDTKVTPPPPQQSRQPDPYREPIS